MTGDGKVEASFLLFFLKGRSAKFATLIMMTYDCRLHQYTGLGELFGALSLYTVKKFLISDIF